MLSGRLRKKLEELEKQNHADKTPEGKLLGQKRDSLGTAYYQSRSSYIKNSPNAVAWHLLYEDVRRHKRSPIDLLDARKNLDFLSEKFPGHPYIELISGFLASYHGIKKGETYVDFEAPDLEDKPFRLSELIEGKVALLDLWASWCKPCLTDSRKIVPIYEEFKDRGFTVVGVAREFKDTNALTFALARENYPWKNLVELDDQNQIWLKYNIAFSGGGLFLIDKDGKFLAVDVGPEKVREILEEKF